jgi:hypothetical protein
LLTSNLADFTRILGNALFRFPLPKKEKAKLNQWLAKTGGIDGKAFGLESESMHSKKLYTLLEQRVLALS